MLHAFKRLLGLGLTPGWVLDLDQGLVRLLDRLLVDGSRLLRSGVLMCEENDRSRPDDSSVHLVDDGTVALRLEALDQLHRLMRRPTTSGHGVVGVEHVLLGNGCSPEQRIF